MLKRGMLLLLTVCLPLLFVACAATEPFDAGTPLTPGEVAALQAQLKNEKPHEGGTQNGGDTTPSGDEENSNIPQNGIVFWLDTGSVYHSSEGCYHIKEKQNVRQGTVTEASEAGKSRLCTACNSD